ncbi:MAG: hypothetical protein IKG23_04605 [Clostridia bacterium]|nr:hypothetical protein [Clostridia bacterium]
MSMNAEEFLSQAYRIDLQIQSKVDQLDRLRACAYGSGIRYGDVKVQTSGPPNHVEDSVLKIMEEERALNEEIDRLVDIKRQIREVISRVQDVTYRLLLEKRCLLFETWRKIGIDMNLSERWAQIIYREAVEVVDEILSGLESSDDSQPG